ncbi:MAG: hypothetical protein RR933_04130 [Oscillospiraceae bacterium]
MAKTTDAVILKEKRDRARRFRRQALGVFFVCLAVIGAGTIIFGAGNFIYSAFFDDTSDKQNFQELIAPLVSMDPTPFESIEDANQDILLEASIWAALEYEDTSKYTRNEYDAIILPSVDVERYITKMYGPSYVIAHHSFFDLDIEFVYDSDLSAYIIPITSQSGSYIPFVEDIKSSGKSKILTVAYMQYSTSSVDIVTDSSAQTVSKYMEYVMRKDSKGYYIYAVREQPKQSA